MGHEESTRLTAYILRRLLFAVFVVWGAVTIIFVIVRVVPGDPAGVMLGPSATVEQVEALRTRLGLDRPMLEQYLSFVGDAARLDFGQSLRLGIPASAAVVDRLPATAALALLAVVIALLVSFPLGIRSARKPGSAQDHAIRVGSLFALSMPTFWVGIMLLLVLARWLKLFPSSGSGSIQHYILPAIVLALPLIGTLVRLIRGGLLDVLGQDYVRSATAKGLRPRSVMFGHAVPNMLIPVVTVVGLMLGDLLAGLVLVEAVFAWPGLGRLLVDGITNRDYPIIQATVAFIALTYALINLGVDILYGYLDPRISVGGRAT
jgi:ABC-type dipeptide/oligopeptide/nickel transport system permease component